MSPSEEYLSQVIGSQTQLYAYILTLLADTSAADDVLQETNMVLLRKSAEFTAGACFQAWAYRIARLQCMAYWKTRTRNRLVFDEDALSLIASRVEERLEDLGERMLALRRCLAQLPRQHRELLESRYADEGSVKQLAAKLGRPEASISQSLYRIRNVLVECVNEKLSSAGGGSL